jgi:hypothetical protein
VNPRKPFRGGTISVVSDAETDTVIDVVAHLPGGNTVQARCQVVHVGLDLVDGRQVLRLELESVGEVARLPDE